MSWSRDTIRTGLEAITRCQEPAVREFIRIIRIPGPPFTLWGTSTPVLTSSNLKISYDVNQIYVLNNITGFMIVNLITLDGSCGGGGCSCSCWTCSGWPWTFICIAE